MHWLDALLGLRAFGPKAFARGYGDEALLARLAEHDPRGPIPDLDLRMHARGPGVYEATFVHPIAAAWLPKPAQTAHVRWYVPKRVRGAYVHLASTGDEGWARRAPVVERALLAWLARSFGRDVGVTGFSMGGSIAALTATTWHEPLAIVPVAAGHAAETVFCDGALSRFVDFGAVDRARLRRLLGRGDLCALPAPPEGSRCTLVAARDDGYVPAWSVERLADDWSRRGLRVAVEWTSGGHATLLLTGRARIAAALARTIAA